MAVYVDTGGWIALLDSKDSNHSAGTSVYRRLQKSREGLVTGWHTLVELTDGLARHFGQARAARLLRDLASAPTLRIEGSEAHIDAAMQLFSQHTDWEVDFSDCLSFALMRELRIRKVLAFDGDFSKAGFELLP